MIEFGGWEMPVYYTSIMEEHLAVRAAVGVFDISHMGQILVSGPDAATFLNRVLTNNITKLAVGQGQYTLLLNQRGGVIDDLIAYRLDEHLYFLVVNASRIEADFTWLEQQRDGEDMEISNQSADYAGLAVQGPTAVALLTSFLGAELPPRNGMIEVVAHGVSFLVGRTGYTGEDGAEIFFATPEAVKVWQKLLSLRAKPCGLGARDTLRLEVCYPLNGSDLSPERTPLEAGLGLFVDLAKGPFVGRETLQAQKASGITHKLTPFTMTSKSPPPRSHYPVLIGGEVVGETCSGGLSPSLGCGIGMAYLPVSATPGTELEIDVRGRNFPAIVAKKPLYQKS
jgi:aminomethyltransferase